MEKRGNVVAIVGANWGDEGKGKIVDILSSKSDFVVRFQGGSNAGHTIINEYGKFALHQLPSGIFYPNVINIIGNGCALNIEYLKKEMETVRNGAPQLDFNLKISNRVQILMPHHILLDELEENRRGDRLFGSTKNGIAPFYSDKFLKEGIQVNEIFDEVHIKTRLKHMYEKVNVILKNLYNAESIDYMQVYDRLQYAAAFVQNYLVDASKILYDAWEGGKNILLEGQLGALRDIDFGIYPYTTSSNTIAGFASAGSGLPPYAIQNIIATTKAYSSCVGEGAFVSEIFAEQAQELRQRGGDAGEYGATTGRSRRVGFFDAVATRFGARMQGATEIALTGIDVLSYLDEIPVCVAYEIDGVETRDFPTHIQLKNAKPVYKVLPGFREEIRHIRNFSDLPKNAQEYVKFLEKEIGVKITLLSNGPKRSEMITLGE